MLTEFIPPMLCSKLSNCTLLNILSGLVFCKLNPPDSPLISLTAPGVNMSTIYMLFFPVSIGISSRTLLLGLLFLSLNSQILHQDHFCNSSYQPHYRLWNLPLPFKPCFQVFSCFSNIIWLSNYQHHVEKQPEKKFLNPQGTQYLPFFISVLCSVLVSTI